MQSAGGMMLSGLVLFDLRRVGCRDSRGEGLSGRVATKEAGVSSLTRDSRGAFGLIVSVRVRLVDVVADIGIHHGSTKTITDNFKRSTCPTNKQYDVAKVNKKITLINPSCPTSSRILRDILREHPLLFSLMASALVLWIYIQQVWHTLKLDDSKDKFKFFIDTKEFTFLVDDFKRVFQLPQATDNNHDLPQPWHTLEKIFARCLTTRVTGVDQPSFQIMQMLYCFINSVHVDYTAIIREGLHYSYLHPKTVIPYPRFTKIIVDQIMTKNRDIPKWLHEHYHKAENNDVVKSIFNSEKNNLDEATQLSITTARSIEELEAHQAIRKVQEYLVDEEIEGNDDVDEN
ncbi:hypothetical protein Tco_0688380 [Tanacetum coccineum]